MLIICAIIFDMDTTLLIKAMADWSILPILLLATYALVFKVPRGKRIQSYNTIVLAGLTSYLLAQLVAIVYQPDALRPFQLLGASAGASFLNNPGFPSDHVLFVTAATCAVWFQTHQKVITIIMSVLVIIMGVGRILALVHSPIDIIGGLLLGLVGIVWYLNPILCRPKSTKRAVEE